MDKNSFKNNIYFNLEYNSEDEKSEDEKSEDENINKKYIEIDPELYRPAEVEYLRGNSSKAHNILGWQPEINFRDLVVDMVDSDIKNYENNYATKF